ncbi:MAG: DUF748 domain-containing protein [Planctomycetota bacterium]
MPIKLGIDRLKVSGFQVKFEDRTLKDKFEHTVAFDFELTGFVSVPDSENPLSFEAMTDAGERFAWSGDFRLDPLSSKGRLEIDGLDLSVYNAYYDTMADAAVGAGRVSLRVGYVFHPVRNARELKISLERFAVEDLAVTSAADGEELVSLALFEVLGVEVDAVAHTVAGDTVRLVGGEVSVVMGEDERLNLERVLANEGVRPAATQPETQPATQPGTQPDSAAIARLSEDVFDLGDALEGRYVWVGGSAMGQEVTRRARTIEDVALALQGLAERAAEAEWDLALDSVVVEDQTLRWIDRRAATPAEIVVSGAGVEAGPIASSNGFATEVAVSGTFAETGRFSVEGPVDAVNLGVDVAVELEDWPLSVVGPYVADALKASGGTGLSSGELTVVGQVTLTPTGEDLPLAGYAGKVELTGLKVDGQSEDAPLAAAEAVRVLEIDARVDPNALGVTEPRAWLLAQEVGMSIEVDGGAGRFVDTSVDPPLELSARELRLRLMQFSSHPEDLADLDLSVKVQDRGSVDVKGPVQLLRDPPELRGVKPKIVSVPLADFSAFSVPVTGYKIGRGRLSVEFPEGAPLTIKDGKIDASPKITISGFRFGEKVGHPDAISLPWNLAIGILTDADGNIVLEPGISDDLNDPSVSVGAIVFRVVRNTADKVVRAPITFLASLVPGGGGLAGVSRLGFDAGSSELGADQAEQVSRFAEALTQRPAVVVGLVGRTGEADVLPLKRQALREQAVARAVARGGGAEAEGVGDPEVLYRREVVRRYLAARVAEEQAADGEGEAAATRPAADGGLGPDANGGRGPGTWVYESGSRIGRNRAGGRWVFVPAAVGEGADVVIGADAEGKGGVPFAEAEAEVLDGVELPADALHKLAAARAEAVRQVLIEGDVEADRIELPSGEQLEGYQFEKEPEAEPAVYLGVGV